MFILKGILRAESQEKILLYLLVRSKGYGSAIAQFFGTSQNSIQKQLSRLEAEGVVVSKANGQLREYELNPRYAFYKPLKNLLGAALKGYPQEQQKNLLLERSRPRKAEKPLINAV